MINLLFSFRGRVRRGDFWYAVLVVMSALAILDIGCERVLERSIPLLLCIPIYWSLLPLLYLFTPLLSFADYELGWFVRWAGGAIMVVSIWLFWRSHVDLGENWSVSLELRENHQLISRGVYRRVRHPMYASIWLWGLAQGMMLANWLAGWSALIAFAAMYFIRVPREERLMYEKFGDNYRDYARRTGRLVPRFTSLAEPSHRD